MAYQRISWSPGRPVPLGTQVLEKTWRTNPANFGKHNTKNNSKSNPKNPSNKIWKSYMEIQSENLPSDPPFCFFSYIDNRALVCIRQSAAAIIHGTKNGPPRISVTGKNRLGPSFSVWEAIGMFEINTSKRRNAYVLHIKLVLKNQLGGVLLDVLLVIGFCPSVALEKSPAIVAVKSSTKAHFPCSKRHNGLEGVQLRSSTKCYQRVIPLLTIIFTMIHHKY